MPTKRVYRVKGKKKGPRFKSGFQIEKQKIVFFNPSLMESEALPLPQKQKRLYTKPDNYFFQETHEQKIDTVKETTSADSKEMCLAKSFTATSVNIVYIKGCAEIGSAVKIKND